ncbi:uncharacterized protein [Panulirus ornatus]|uniref:uncharacterized protein isoform X8 n=1 Tax=Panulirus ornatus TaxID=150431 RepID=UPI003A86B26E
MPADMHSGGGSMGLEGSLASHASYGSSAASSLGAGRVKVVRLVRRNGESYGFSLRGGREHGTGFFISHVEPGSEAFLQGLRAGDQVLRVNNVGVEQLLHREVTAMVQSKTSVLLKLKSAGIIPLKEHRGDPLTWLVVDDDEELSDQGTDSSLPSCSAHESELDSFHQPHPAASPPAAGNEHARVYLSCTGKVGLGCSICKGPPEKPGIFVQSVRPGGVARNAGLRPGDLILACNDISFAHLEFAEAVYVLKSSPRLAVDVLRGAGLDLVAGESSGYNSSASSVAGDQTPPSSSSDPRDSDYSVTSSRLSAVSRHLTLDRTRGWREIESEWAEAEAEEKRRQLLTSQKTLRTRAQRDASHRLCSVGSRSLSNLSAALREEDDEQRTAFRDAGPAHTHYVTPTHALLTPTHAHYKPTLRSTRSTNDVTEDTNHKIALMTSADPHVNNIVVTGGPKDERDALFRLDQLSSPSASRTSTLSSGTSQVTVQSSSDSGDSPSIGKATSSELKESVVEQQLQQLREEQRRLQEEANRLAQERQKFEEEKRRGLERTQSAPLAPLVITCSGQSLSPHLQPPPSPTSSISSGRHTTRVLIKSPPPPPPPRKNTTTLSSHSNFQPHLISPPASPAHSSSSSSGVGSSCGSGVPPRRCKSIGSLSASSGESTVWEDSPLANRVLPVNTHPTFRSTMPPPTPPKPPAPPGTHSSSTSVPQNLGGAPPPPPPPPPQPTSSSSQSSLAAAINKELERRSTQETQLGLTGDDKSKAQMIEEKLDAFKKNKQKTGPPDPKRAQHDKLMEEFKLAHKKMFLAKDSASEDPKEKNETKIQNHPKLTRLPPSQVEFNSKIISNSSIRQNLDSVSNKTKAISSNLSSGLTSSPSNDIKSRITIIERNEQSGGNNTSSSSSSSSSAPTKSPVRPTVGKVTVIEEFNHGEKTSPSLRSSNAYVEPMRTTSGKPLVSISAYPSPNHRPTPVKMDFLPTSSNNNEMNGNNVVDGSSRACLQKELVSTLSRSNLRQRYVPQQLPPDPPSASSSSSSLSSSNAELSSNAIKPATFNTTTVQNNATSPKASLSTKYRGIGQEAPVTIIMKGDCGKENEAPESPPTGILKPSGPASSIRPLQKSISFGDVTTVGEDDPRT